MKEPTTDLKELSTKISNWKDLEETETLRIIRSLKKANRLDLIPSYDIYMSGVKSLKSEVVKNIRYDSSQDWLELVSKILVSDNARDALTVFSRIPKIADKNYSNESISKLILTVLESDNVSEEVLAAFIPLPEVNSLMLNALSYKKVSDTVLEAVLESENITATALNYQLDNRGWEELLYSYSSIKNRQLVELFKFSDELSYTNFCKLYTLVEVAPNINRTEIEAYGTDSFSQNWFRARREGIIGGGVKPRRTLYSSKNALININHYYKKMFPDDRSWESLLQFGMIPNQIELVRSVSKHILDTIYDRKRDVHLKKVVFDDINFELSDIAQKTIISYAVEDAEIANTVSDALIADSNIFTLENLKLFIHSVNFDNIVFPYPKNLVNNSSIEILFKLCYLCCSKSTAECPAWRALALRRYYLSEASLVKFLSDFDSPEFYPFVFSMRIAHRISDSELYNLSDYVERTGLEHVSQELRDSYAKIKTFID